MKKSLLDLPVVMFDYFAQEYGNKKILSQKEQVSPFIPKKEKENKKRGVVQRYFDDQRLTCGKKESVLICPFSPIGKTVGRTPSIPFIDTEIQNNPVYTNGSMYYRHTEAPFPCPLPIVSEKKSFIFFNFILITRLLSTEFALSVTNTPITKLATPPIIFSVCCTCSKKTEGAGIMKCEQYSRLYDPRLPCGSE